jgi:hypothetical protein
MVLGMVEVTTAWWYEIVLYGGNGVGRPIGDFNRWCPSSSFMNMCSIFSVARYGKVKTVGSTSILYGAKLRRRCGILVVGKIRR